MEILAKKSSGRVLRRTKSNAEVVVGDNSEESDYTPPSERCFVQDLTSWSQRNREIFPDFLVEATQSPGTKVKNWISSNSILGDNDARFIPLSEAHLNSITTYKQYKRSNQPIVNNLVRKPSNIMLRETYKGVSEECDSPDDARQIPKQNNVAKLKPKVQNLSPKNCSHNGSILIDQKGDNCVGNISPESSKMREFYSYLKIDTNPTARKLESVHTQRRSKRVQRQVLANEKHQLDIIASKVQTSSEDISSCSLENINKDISLTKFSSKKRQLKDDMKYKMSKRNTKVEFSPDSAVSIANATENTSNSKKYVPSERISEEFLQSELQFACKLFYQSAISLQNGIKRMKSSNFDDVMQQYIKSENLNIPITIKKNCKQEKENVDCNTANSDKITELNCVKMTTKLQSNHPKGLSCDLAKSVHKVEKVNGINNHIKPKVNSRCNRMNETYRKRPNTAAKNLIVKYSRRSLRSSPKIRGTLNSWNSLIIRNNRSIRLGRRKSALLRLKTQNMKNNNAEDCGAKEKELESPKEVKLKQLKEKKVSVTNTKETKQEDNFTPIKIVSASDFTKFEEIKLANIKINDSDSSLRSSEKTTPHLFGSQESSEWSLKTNFKRNLTDIISTLNDVPKISNEVSPGKTLVEASSSNLITLQKEDENVPDSATEISSSSCFKVQKMDTSDLLSVSSCDMYDNRKIEICAVDPNTKTPTKDYPIPSIPAHPCTPPLSSTVTSSEILTVSSSSELTFEPCEIIPSSLAEKTISSSTSVYKTAQSTLSSMENVVASSSSLGSEEPMQIISPTNLHTLQAEVVSNVKDSNGEMVNPQTITPKRSKYIPLSDSIEPKSLHKSLVHTKRPKITPQEQISALTSTQNLFNDFECPKSPTPNCQQPISPLKVLNRKNPQPSSSSLSAHSVHLLEEDYGSVLHATYLDHHLILAQERAVGFWNNSALGQVLGAQNMWVPRGRIQRLVLGPGCENRISKEMSVACDESIAYLELWTKEHKSEKREQPIADVFVSVYFCRRKEGKKVLQLENIKGSADTVQYVVMKHSRIVVVSWRMVKENESTTLIRSYLLEDDFQTVKSTKEMKSVDNYVISLHNIENCDTLVMGAGENNINIWNLEFGCLVATVQLQKLSYQPDILWANCDRGYLFIVQQFSGNLLQLVAINGLNYNWKSLQTYRPPNLQDQRLQGVAINGGVLVGFFNKELLCWNMQTGRLLLNEKLQPNLKYIPGNQHVIVINEEQVQIRDILFHILSN